MFGWISNGLGRGCLVEAGISVAYYTGLLFFEVNLASLWGRTNKTEQDPAFQSRARAHANVAVRQRRALAAFSKGCIESSGFRILVLANGKWKYSYNLLKLKEHKKDPWFLQLNQKCQTKWNCHELSTRMDGQIWVCRTIFLMICKVA